MLIAIVLSVSADLEGRFLLFWDFPYGWAIMDEGCITTDGDVVDEDGEQSRDRAAISAFLWVETSGDGLHHAAAKEHGSVSSYERVFRELDSAAAPGRPLAYPGLGMSLRNCA